MRFVHSFGLVCGNLKSSNVLFDESQIVDIVPSQAESHCRENCVEVLGGRTERCRSLRRPQFLPDRKLTQKADVLAFAEMDERIGCATCNAIP
jgi:hypothetical protein